MKLLNVEAHLHWGYSVKVPNTGKAQPSLNIPPPSTLIGAISLPIAKHRGTGETFVDEGKLIGVADLYRPIFKAAACRLIGKATYSEDINRYIIALFQNSARRFEQEYRFNAIPAGKVYGPNQKIRMVYLVDENSALQILGEDWHAEIESAAYQISRIGSKESIVSVENVKLSDANTVRGKVSTSLYFPFEFAEVVNGGEFFFADFWLPSYALGKRPQMVRYIVPASRAPIIESSILQVNVKTSAYTNGEDTIIAGS